MEIKFIHEGGPYGDCTSNYTVTFPERTTVGEFIQYIINDYSVEAKEWGDFMVVGVRHCRPLLQYDCGRSFFKEPWSNKKECEPLLESIIDKKIKKISANGGWSAMSYTLTLVWEEE